MSDDNIQYTLSIDTLAAELVAVTGFAGAEALSTPFEFTIDFVPFEHLPLPYLELVGQKATLTFRPPHGQERHVNGKIAAAESLGDQDGRHRYRVQLVPRLAELGLNRRSRIFQAMSTLDIVKKVLDEGKVEHRASVNGSYQPREYCVQYGESDAQFVRRLLEEEGIFFYFEHTESSHVMVLMDDATACPASGAALPFRPEIGGVTTEAHVSQFTAGGRLRPGKVTLRDFNFKTPHADLTAAATGVADNKDMERYEHPGVYLAAGAGSARAAVRLAEEQRDLAFHEAVSDCPGLLPGYGFAVMEHAVSSLDGDYLVVGITHQADDRLYRNRASCIPASHPFRPPRTTARPLAPGVQTAMVVGPAGEEIFTDEHGRIKVQFHWDREGKHDDHASCFMRVSQHWAGMGYGALYLPRIGHEVVVRFIDADPDRPVVIGCVYNGANPPPVELPAHKTRSTVRTASSPGSGGDNELRFEDASGQEEIYAHAQKDEKIVVENDKTQEVRANESLLVEKDRSREIDKNQTLLVHGNDTSTVEKNQTLTVQGKRTTETTGNHTESVGSVQSITVGALHVMKVAEDSTEDIGAAKAITVGGALVVLAHETIEQEVKGRFLQAIGGLHSEWVKGDREEEIGEDMSLTVGGNLIIDLPDGALSVKVEKDGKGEVTGEETWSIKELSQWHGQKIQMKADKLSFVVNDKKLLDMQKSGDIKIAASKIVIEGDQIKAKGSTIDMVGAGSAPSGKAKEAKPEKLAVKDPKAAKAVEFKLELAGGDPINGVKFKATLPDGTVVEGKLDSSGKASISGLEKGDVKIEFPEVDDSPPPAAPQEKIQDQDEEVKEEEQKKRAPGDGKFVLITDIPPEEAEESKDVFVLKSTDGRFSDQRKAADGKPTDGLLEIEFKGLPRDASYTLVIKHEDGEEMEVFKKVPFHLLGQHADELERQEIAGGSG